MATKEKAAKPRKSVKVELSAEDIKHATKAASEGATLDEIADELGLSKTTLDRRIGDNKELSEALRRARCRANAKVRSQAYKMAASGKNERMTKFWLAVRMGWVEPKPEPSNEESKPFKLAYEREKKAVEG